MASSSGQPGKMRPLSLAQRPLQLRSSSAVDIVSQQPPPITTESQRQKRFSTLSYASPSVTTSIVSPIQSPIPGLSRSSSRSDTRRRPSSFYGSSPITPATPSGGEEVPSQEQPTRRDSTDTTVMILAETHADLLHSIAQKEAKCLELRTQLSQQESELKELKAQWTSIVQKTVPASSLAGNGAGAGNSISMAGAAVFREGMGRLFSNVTAPLASALDALDPTTHEAGVNSGTQGTETPERARKKMVRGHTPNSSSRSSASTSNSSFAASRHSISSASSSAGGGGRMDPFANLQFDEKVATSSPLSRTGPDYFATESAEMGGRSKSATPTPTSMQDQRSDSPTTVWATGIPAIDGLNKKWEEIQRGDTFVKNSRRASTLLSDVSASFISTFAPPLNEPLRHQKPRLVSSRPAGTTAAAVVPVAPSSSTRSLLDDDDEDTHAQLVMEPSKPTPLDVSSVRKEIPKANEEEDAWNW